MIQCRQTEETVTITVSDHGIGIPLDKQKYIRQILSRSDRESS